MGVREAVAAHFYPKRARTHNQHGRSCRAAGAAAAATPHGIVEVVSGAAGWRPFGQALASPTPSTPSAKQNKNEQDEFTRYKKNLYLCMYEWEGVQVCVWVCECARGKR